MSSHPGPVRVLHLVTVPFRPEEGVSRAVTETAAAMTGVASHLAADHPVGSSFAGHHHLRRWEPWPAIAGREVRALLDEIQPDLVHLHGGVLVGALAAAPASRNIPVVATVYQLLPVPRGELGVRNLLDAHRSALRPARIVGSGLVGRPLLRQLLRHGTIGAVCTPDPRVESLLRNDGPVVITRGGATPQRRRSKWSDAPVVAFAGRAEQGRGVEQLIEAVDLLRRDLPRLTLRLHLLPGPAADRWNHQYADHPGVELSIGVHADLGAELARAQVVALPFRIPATITPPLVAAQAMSFGVPIVSTRLSCLTPLVRSGVNGMLADTVAPADLARAIRSVLSDRLTWERLAIGAHATIEREWNWVGAARATEEAYATALRRAAVGERQRSHPRLSLPAVFPEAAERSG